MSDRIRTDLPRTIAVFLIGCIPLVIHWMYKVLLHPRPFWIQFYDPESIYFYEGLRIARGQAPLKVDNPGTPVQLMSAAIASITGLTPAAYERFLAVGHALVLGLMLLAMLLLVLTVLRTAPPLLAIAALWSYFLTPQALERMDIWGPEAFYFTAGAIAIAFAIPWFERGNRRALFGFAAAIGLCLSIKLVFLGWAVALIVDVMTRKSWRTILIGAGGLATGFVVGTLPILPRYPDMLSRLMQLTGRSPEVPWASLLSTQKFWILWIAIVLLFALPRLRSSKRLLLFAGIAFLMTYAGALRSPSFRYLLPTGMIVTLLFVASASKNSSFPTQAVVFAIALLFLGMAMQDDINAHRLRIAEQQGLRAEIERIVGTHSVLYCWRVPMPSFALRVLASDARDLDVVAHLYPREGHYDVWTHTIHAPRGGRWDLLVIHKSELAFFPEPLGRVAGHAAQYVIVSGRNRK